MTLRCGRIRYTNVLPIYAAFDAGAIAFPGSLHAEVPSRLNAMLLDGELDLSPVSAFAWAGNTDDLVLMPDVCVGARDEVMSVVLVSATPPALLNGAAIAVTGDSESGRNLLRVLLERRYGVRAAYAVDADPLSHARDGRPALLIGDAAIDAVQTLPSNWIYDLGRSWHEWTGHQTVFAVWATRRDVYARDPNGVAACMRAFTGAAAWGRAHAADVVAQAQRTIARPPGFYERYYDALSFTFDSAAQSGLRAFCGELAAIGAIARVPSTVPEVLDAVAG